MHRFSIKNCDSRDSVQHSNATSNWFSFDQALRKYKTCWSKNQYLLEWYLKILNQSIEKMIIWSKDQMKTASKKHQKIETRSHDKPTIFFIIERQLYSKSWIKLTKLCELQVVFMTRLLKFKLPALKASFYGDLKFQAKYEIKRKEWRSSYVGQTSRLLPLGYQKI